MKKKIKDLTIEEIMNYCHTRTCGECNIKCDKKADHFEYICFDTLVRKFDLEQEVEVSKGE